MRATERARQGERKTRGSNAVGASSPKSLARSCCPKKPSLAGSTLHGISIAVLSRPDLGTTRPVPDSSDASRALRCCCSPGCCSHSPTGGASAPGNIFQCAAYGSCVCVMHAGTTRHIRHTEVGVRQLSFECTYTSVSCRRVKVLKFLISDDFLSHEI